MAGRVMQIELAAGQWELIDSAQLTPAVFEPEPVLSPAEHNVPLTHPTSTLPVREPRSHPDELVTRAIEVDYPPHRIGACLGEQIKVVPVRSTQADSYLEVQGLVETAERRAEVKRALADLPGVRLSVKTTEEALKDAVLEATPEATFSNGTRISNRA